MISRGSENRSRAEFGIRGLAEVLGSHVAVVTSLGSWGLEFRVEGS